MPTVRVESAVRSLGSFRFSYPIRLTLDDGSDVLLHRYYSDFVELRAALMKGAINTSLPTLPEKKWDGRDRVRERRRASFQYFLDWCLIHAKNDAKLLSFFNVMSLDVKVPAAESTEGIADIPESVTTGRVGGSGQTLIKFSFFAFLWLLTWRAMLIAPRSTVSSTVDLLPIAGTETASVWGQAHAENAPNVVLVRVESDHTLSTAIHAIIAETAIPRPSEAHLSVEEPVSKNPTEDVSAAIEEEKSAHEHDFSADEKMVPLEDIAEGTVVAREEQEKVVLESIDEAVIAVEPRTEDVLVEAGGETRLVAPTEMLDSKQETGSNQVTIEEEIKSTGRDNFSNQTKKPEVEFFFTPMRGLMAFIGLYIAVLAWSTYYPPRTERLPTEIRFRENSPRNALSKSKAAKQEKQLVLSEEETGHPNDAQEEGRASPRAEMSFEKAQELFAQMRVRVSNEQASNRAMAFLMRATGQDAQSSSVKVLQQFWEEASAMTPIEAQARFMLLVQSGLCENDQSINLTDVVLQSSSHELQRDEAMEKTRTAYDWFQKPIDDQSNITSFDSTDISSLSATPSPIRQPQEEMLKNGEGGKPTILRFAEHENDDEDRKRPNETLEVALGAVVGLVGTAVAFGVARRMRARLF